MYPMRGEYNGRQVYYMTRCARSPFARVTWFCPWMGVPQDTSMRAR